MLSGQQPSNNNISNVNGNDFSFALVRGISSSLSCVCIFNDYFNQQISDLIVQEFNLSCRDFSFSISCGQAPHTDRLCMDNVVVVSSQLVASRSLQASNCWLFLSFDPTAIYLVCTYALWSPIDRRHRRRSILSDWMVQRATRGARWIVVNWGKKSRPRLRDGEKKKIKSN